MKKLSILLASAALFFACTPEAKVDIYEGLDHQTYKESDENIANPERGFYNVLSFHSSNGNSIAQSSIESLRFLGRTLFHTSYYPVEFMESDISEEFLNLMRANMQALRDGGAKCILRFAYSDSQDEKPYDPKPEIVHRHIQNIKPILQEYGDVILCFQAGFIGVWGEWYYTDNFVSNPQTPAQHALRKEVVDAMLDALPADRQVALRTPMFKKNMYAESYADTLTIATAHNGTPKARLCSFNDCFGASSNDTGTFNGPDSRQYWKTESRYLFMGGETCGVSAYCKCKNSLKDMEDYHWTYLNSQYHMNVIGGWRNDGCMPEIERRLGYRLSLSDVYHTPVPVPGQDMRIALKLKNSGFSAPINPRAVELILVDGNGNKTVYELDDVDPRYWFAGADIAVDKHITLPADASGQCTLYLNLPDPKETLHDNPRFSIRLANKDVWEDETGYNKVLEFTL